MDRHKNELEYEVVVVLYLKIITYKGKDITSKNAKLSPSYMGMIKIL